MKRSSQPRSMLIIGVTSTLVTLATCLLALAPSCAKKEDGARSKVQKGPAPLKKAEVDRGVSACKDFEVKVCSCAKLDPENAQLNQDCDLADERIKALEISNRAGGTVNSTADERGAAISNSRLIIKSCIEGAAALAGGCPKRIRAETVEAFEEAAGDAADQTGGAGVGSSP